MQQKVWSYKAKKFAVVSAAVTVLLAVLLLVRHFSGASVSSARIELLRFVPADTTSVVFIDFGQLRASPFLASLESWAPHPAEDSEYAQFVRDTGFRYERDLNKVFVAFINHGTASATLALAEGKFDRAKIETFLKRNAKPVQQGNLQIYVLPGDGNEKPLSVALLSDQRIAITNAGDLSSQLSEAARQPEHGEWASRFDRLAGSPAFAMMRQDSAIQSAFGAAAPGGLRSPQLATLLGELQWISIAGKPEGDLLQVVAEGECPSNNEATQLRDLLQGIQILAQTGLNDSKLRQQMDPQERESYIELLKGADIQKLDRGDSKSVRLVLRVTPQFLEVAKAGYLGRRQGSVSELAGSSTSGQTAHRTKPAAKK